MDQDYTVEAAVTDQANREITGRGRFLATRGTFRIHVEPVSYAIRAGDTALFNVTAVDYDNHPVQTRVHLQLVTHKYCQRKDPDHPWRRHRCDHRRQWTGPGIYPRQPGRQHRSRGQRHHPGKSRRLRLQLSVGDGQQRRRMGRGSRAVQMIADKKSYAPGDTAHLSILSNVDNFHPLVIATGNTVEFRKVMFSPGQVADLRPAHHGGRPAQPGSNRCLHPQRSALPGQPEHQGSSRTAAVTNRHHPGQGGLSAATDRFLRRVCPRLPGQAGQRRL